MVDIELPSLPPTTGLLARSVLATPFRPSARAGLPQRRVVVRGVAQDVSRLAAYNRVCGFVLRDVVPSTWLHVQTFPLQVYLMAERDFPFGLAGLVHVKNVIEQHRPVTVNETVDLATHAEGPSPHRRGMTFDLVNEARVGGNLVWRGVSTYLARMLTKSVVPNPVDKSAPTDPPPATARWTLPADLGRRYAKVSGDANPIHINAVTARAFGYGRPIIHGMWTFAHVLAALDERLPAAYRADMAFRAPIPLPERVDFAVSGRFDVSVLRAGGKPYLTGFVGDLGDIGAEAHSE